MSKYVSPRLRKEQTDDEKKNAITEMLRNVTISDFPVLGSGVQVHRLPKLEYASKAVEWEQKRRDIEEKQRVDDYVKKIEEEKAKDAILMTSIMQVPGIKKPALSIQIVKDIPPPPVPVDEWTRVDRKVRKQKKEFNFEEEDDHIDFLAPEDH